MENYVCDRAIMEELVHYGSVRGWAAGMAESFVADRQRGRASRNAPALLTHGFPFSAAPFA